jgi:hypothetical protein
MKIDFRESARLMAERLRIMQRLQQQAQDEGRQDLEIATPALFSAADKAALDAYERDLMLHSGAVALFPVEG